MRTSRSATITLRSVALVMWVTCQPQTTITSAISLRWQRHQSSSEHMMAVRDALATCSSACNPCANSSDLRCCAYARNEGRRQAVPSSSRRSGRRRPPSSENQR